MNIQAQRSRQVLHDNWVFRQSGVPGWKPATVPGTVHTDLIHAGMIDDPNFRDNEKAQQWIGEADWEYFTEFDVSPEVFHRRHIELVFEGLDTYAEVYLNGELILQARNMHRTWRLDCTGKLKQTGNRLLVYFHNILAAGQALRVAAPFPLFQFPNNDQTDPQHRISTYVRKAGYHFGWDWGPRLITAGIWRPVYLDAYDQAKISGLQIQTISATPSKARLRVSGDIHAIAESTGEFTLQAEGRELVRVRQRLRPGLNRISQDFDINSPRLWWCNGMGSQELYRFCTELKLDGLLTDTDTVTTGIREIRVHTEKDAWGEGFHLSLNGRPVFIRGANFIPAGNFAPSVTAENYEQLIRSAAAVNMNMLRLWGGGYFENDLFYSLCDRYGILVWQDMLFACGTYPGTDEFLESVAAEVKDNVTRIRNHPSLALYNGNNEVEIAYYQWGWKEKLSPAEQKEQEKAHHRLFYEVIPAAIRQADTSRYYHPTSPNSGYNGRGLGEGDQHYWSVWHGKEPFELYNDHVGRFMSEYGFQSYPLPASVARFTLPEDRHRASQVLQSHQRCLGDELKDKAYGDNLVAHYMQLYYREPALFDDYLYLSQLLQKKALTVAIEAHRRNRPYCMGTLYWQLNDCWPAASWSTIDFYGEWKAAHYRLRDLYKDEMISVLEEGDSIRVYIVSDKPVPVSAQLRIRMFNFTGRQLSQKLIPVTVAPESGAVYASLRSRDWIRDASRSNIVMVTELLEAGSVTASHRYYFQPEKDLNLSPGAVQWGVAVSGDRYIISLRATKLARDVWVSVPNSAGTFSDNFFDLLPGESRRIEFIPGKPVAGLEKSFQVRSLGDIGWKQ